jgi:hypothetical protein
MPPFAGQLLDSPYRDVEVRAAGPDGVTAPFGQM